MGPFLGIAQTLTLVSDRIAGFSMSSHPWTTAAGSMACFAVSPGLSPLLPSRLACMLHVLADSALSWPCWSSGRFAWFTFAHVIPGEDSHFDGSCHLPWEVPSSFLWIWMEHKKIKLRVNSPSPGLSSLWPGWMAGSAISRPFTLAAWPTSVYATRAHW